VRDKKLVVVGCSVTSGDGLYNENTGQDCVNSPDLWVNLCHQHIPQFSKLQLLNLGKGGFSVLSIFLSAIEAISVHNDIEYLICAWTSMPRYNFHVGFELYNTEEMFTPNKLLRDHKLNKGVLTSNYLKTICDKFLALHDAQHEIVSLIRYINILENISKNKDIKILNVNALCPWDHKFFDVLSGHFIPSDFTPFTREILTVNNRNDEEIATLYQQQHEMYAKVGGIRPQTWVNLYNSFYNEIIDRNYDGSHPGIKSNQRFFEIVKNYIETNY